METTSEKKTETKGRYFPLPDDYYELTAEGQRLARLSVVCDQSTPEKAVISSFFFVSYYFPPESPFYKEYKTSPDFHYQIPYDMARYRSNILAAPRGAAKSVRASLLEPMRLVLTRPTPTGVNIPIRYGPFEVGLCFASLALVNERFETFMEQFESNERIHQDFGNPRRRMKGTGAKGLWSHRYLKLANGSILKGFTTDGRKRGGRPDLFILDDPEFDTQNSVTSEKMRSEFETMLYQVVLPMLEKNAGVFWVGTIIDRRTMIYRAFTNEDKRFSYWNRRLLAAAEYSGNEEETGQRFSNFLWPQKWDEEELRRIETELGPTVFAAEMLNSPVSHEYRVLCRNDTKTGFRFEGAVNFQNPWDSGASASIRHHVRNKSTEKWVLTDTPFDDFLNGLFIMVLTDFAYTVKPTSDDSCIMVVGVDKDDVVWVLDLWVGKGTQDRLDSLMLSFGKKWKASYICPEDVARQGMIVGRFKKKMEEQAAQSNWSARVVPPRYPRSLAKQNRIASLEWRFCQGRIKLPINEDMVHRKPWSVLFNQLDNFTLDLSLLVRDDAADTLSMVHYVPYRKGSDLKSEKAKTPTVVEKLRKGQKIDDQTGLPLISGLNMSDIDEETLWKMKTHHYDGESERGRRRRRNLRTRYDSRRYVFACRRSIS